MLPTLVVSVTHDLQEHIIERQPLVTKKQRPQQIPCQQLSGIVGPDVRKLFAEYRFRILGRQIPPASIEVEAVAQEPRVAACSLLDALEETALVVEREPSDIAVEHGVEGVALYAVRAELSVQRCQPRNEAA